MSALSPARHLAHRVLTRVRERSAYAPQALESAVSQESLPDADAALAHRLVYGTLQMQGSLDEAIDRFVDRPTRLEPRVRDALRISAYEILFSRVPPHAVVDQGVALVRTIRSGAAPLANAVLRRLAEAAPDFPWGDTADPDVLARAVGHPRWIVDLLTEELGEGAARAVLEADNSPAPFYVAHNPFRGPLGDAVARLRADGAEPVPGPLPGCMRCLHPGPAVRSAALRTGLVVVADAAAQFAPLAMGAHPGEQVVDIASGRGTKTVLIQALALSAGAPASIHAVDIHAFKSRVLAERMGALGVPGVHALTGDATDLASISGLPPAGSVDAVLVDAPCSGLGTLRRHPEKRWRLEPADITRLAAVGSAMLGQAASLVRPGGSVVYSTCTITRAENSDVANAFLASEAGAAFRVRRLDPAVPEHWRDRIAPEGWFQSLPELDGPDGHFAVVFERLG